MEKDKLGNSFTIERQGDSFVKVTQTNRLSKFMFLGDVYSYEILRSDMYQKSTVIKTYYSDYHHEASLQQDIYGRLILYFYDEEIRFDDRPDREDHLWLFVEDEADADKMAEKGKLLRLRAPYIAADEESWMAAHEPVAPPA